MKTGVEYFKMAQDQLKVEHFEKEPTLSEIMALAKFLLEVDVQADMLISKNQKKK